jgi:hypothetical protein
MITLNWEFYVDREVKAVKFETIPKSCPFGAERDKRELEA